MINISVSQLKQGMVLSAPVFHPSVGNHVLLQSQYAMERDTIAQLSKFAIESVWIHVPGFECLDAKLGNDIPRCRAKLYRGVKKSFVGIADGTAGSFNVEEYLTLISDTIMAIVANKENAVWAERLMDGGGELFAHCSNVAYLSLVDRKSVV